MARPTNHESRGFSLVEVMVTMLCLGVIGIGVAGVSTSSSRALTTNAVVLEGQMRADRCVERLERHLRAASLGSLETLPPGFETPQPLVEGVPADDLRWLCFAYDPAQADALPTADAAQYSIEAIASAGDPTNGVDDDQDGLLDEVDLVLQRPGAAAETASRDVTQCSFTLDGRMLTISVVVRMRMPDGAPTTARSTRIVEIRND
ncbi:MAG: type II secretion system protein J [Planctomycetota bacterium JB042]